PKVNHYIMAREHANQATLHISCAPPIALRQTPLVDRFLCAPSLRKKSRQLSHSLHIWRGFAQKYK
ncbi:hypothetical protein, partial [Vibrio cholerae]|uniref:hypothetical protein n=1 Tax=Vibrio cholerae TaxID=666 RepID=UPI003D2FFA91